MTDQSAPPFISFTPFFLLDRSADILTNETADDRNDLITSVLPYVVMAFKVSVSHRLIYCCSHVP
jgi:hypothetical protein